MIGPNSDVSARGAAHEMESFIEMAGNENRKTMASESCECLGVEDNFGCGLKNGRDSLRKNNTVQTDCPSSNEGDNSTTNSSRDDLLKPASSIDSEVTPDAPYKFYYSLLSDNDGDTILNLSNSDTESTEDGLPLCADNVGQKSIFLKQPEKTTSQDGSCDDHSHVAKINQTTNQNNLLNEENEPVSQRQRIETFSNQTTSNREKRNNSSDYDYPGKDEETDLFDVKFRSNSIPTKRSLEERYSYDVTKQRCDEVYCSVRSCAMSNSYDDGKSNLEAFVVSDGFDLTVIDIFSLPQEFLNSWDTEAPTAYVQDSDVINKHHKHSNTENGHEYSHDDRKNKHSQFTTVKDSEEVNNAQSTSQIYEYDTETSLTHSDTIHINIGPGSASTVSLSECEITNTSQLDKSEASVQNGNHKTNTALFRRTEPRNTSYISDKDHYSLGCFTISDKSENPCISREKDNDTSVNSESEYSDSSFTSVTDDDNISLRSLSEYLRADESHIDSSVITENCLNDVIAKNTHIGVSQEEHDDVYLVTNQNPVDSYLTTPTYVNDPSVLLKIKHCHLSSVNGEQATTNKLLVDAEPFTNSQSQRVDEYFSSSVRDKYSDVDNSERTSSNRFIAQSEFMASSQAAKEQNALSCVHSVVYKNDCPQKNEWQSEMENTEERQSNANGSEHILMESGDTFISKCGIQFGPGREDFVSSHFVGSDNSCEMVDPKRLSVDRPADVTNDSNNLIKAPDILKTEGRKDCETQTSGLNDFNGSEEFHENYVLDLFFREDTMSDLSDELQEATILETNPSDLCVVKSDTARQDLLINDNGSLSEQGGYYQQSLCLPFVSDENIAQCGPLVENCADSPGTIGKLEIPMHSDCESGRQFYTPPSYDESTIRQIHERLTNEGLYDISKPIEQDSGDKFQSEIALNKTPPTSDEDCDPSKTEKIYNIAVNTEYSEDELSSSFDSIFEETPLSTDLFQDSKNNNRCKSSRDNFCFNENGERTKAPADDERGIYDVYPAYDTDDDSKEKRSYDTFGYRDKNTFRSTSIIDKICQTTVAKRDETTVHAPVRIFRGNPIC